MTTHTHIARHILISLCMYVLAIATMYGQGHVVPTKPTLILSRTDSSLARKQLQTQLDALFTSKYLKSASISAYVKSLKTGHVLYELNPTTCLTPASTTKLFTTAALFKTLEPSCLIRTRIKADGTVDSRGVLNGNIYLVGIGDALLSVNDIESAADAIRESGVKKITGNVYGDDSRFDDEIERSRYSGDGEVVQTTPPITALGVNRNTVSIIVNGSANGTISAQSLPASDAFRIVIGGGAVKSKKGKLRSSKVKIASSIDDKGIQVFTVSGWPGANRTTIVYAQMKRPTLAAAGILRSRLRSGGVEVVGAVGEKSAPGSATALASIDRSAEEFCSIVNKRSDNFLAEQAFKMVGALSVSASHENISTASKARKQVLECLDSMHVSKQNCVFNDGSGLSRRNKVCAKTEVALLQGIAAEPWYKSYYSTLSIAGIDGTLRRRMGGTKAVGNVHAKTGTLRGTSALAGYVTTTDGELLAFSFIENGPSVGAYKAVENKAATALAMFSYLKPIQQSSESIAIEAESITDDSSAIDDDIIENLEASRKKDIIHKEIPPPAKVTPQPSVRPTPSTTRKSPTVSARPSGKNAKVTTPRGRSKSKVSRQATSRKRIATKPAKKKTGTSRRNRRR